MANYFSFYESQIKCVVTMLSTFFRLLQKPIPSGSLAFFRIVYGLLMFISISRFLLNGWVEELYILPKFFFPFFQTTLLQPLPGMGMYFIFSALLLLSLGVLFGFLYKISISLFFLLFTYVELLDKTNYLNHYYLISLISFLMIFLPLSCTFSIDAFLKPSRNKKEVPRWIILVLRLQIGLVYFFAGLAKIKYDWLIEAQPLKIWLSANAGLPIIGPVLGQSWIAYAFSWGGMLFDLSIPFFLIRKRTRFTAFIFIVIFHLITFALFQIGMFPWIMMSLALIFFPPTMHENILKALFNRFTQRTNSLNTAWQSKFNIKFIAALFCIYFIIQVILPLRYLAFPGNVLWTERGFRFSWNVMLMEKNAFIEFSMVDSVTKKKWLVPLSPTLSNQQQRMMASQPDMILQFAHYLAKDYFEKTGRRAEVYAECYASLNGKTSKLLIDPKVNLAKAEMDEKWILN